MTKKRCNVSVEVSDNDVEKAIRKLRKKCQKDGILRDVKNRRYFDKPSVKKRRKWREAEMQRRRDENDSYDDSITF